ncbi:MAG: hypothetical protein PHY70_03210 [Methanocellales archaeon]|nr:hypothetical protein [Methanocellales archaeon]
MIEIEERRSFELINYMLRPKKQIERKIIIEILQELDKEIGISNYIYVGFGSIYYYDFILFHKFLNMNKLVSIDDKSTEKRFKFNRPYDFISFEKKNSTDFLSKFNWDQKAVLWLDYDYKLKDSVLSDLKIIANNCKNKDILMITLNAFCTTEEKKREKDSKEFYNSFGRYVSPGYKARKYFTPRYLPLLLQNVITNYLETMCEYRDIKFYKLFSFNYKDTTNMFTIGGIFDDNDELNNKDWNNKFVCNGEDIKDINVPILTYCEKFYIDSHIEELKREIEKIEKNTKIPNFREKERKMTEKINEILPFELSSFYDLKKYLECYRHYPQYYEGII